MLDQDNNIYMISLSILITNLLDIIRRSYVSITSGGSRVNA